VSSVVAIWIFTIPLFLIALGMNKK